MCSPAAPRRSQPPSVRVAGELWELPGLELRAVSPEVRDARQCPAASQPQGQTCSTDDRFTVFLFSLCYHHRPASGNRSFTGPFVRSAILHLLYVLRVSRPQPEGEMCQACMKSVVHANPLWKLMAVATHMLVKNSPVLNSNHAAECLVPADLSWFKS